MRSFLKWIAAPYREEGDGDGNGGGDGGDGDAGGTILGSGQSGDGDAGAGDQGGDGDAGGAGDTGDGDQASTWAWSEGVAGEGEAPDWLKGDKFKTVEAQAQAFSELETKIGPAAELIGAPEDGNYAVPDTPDGVEGEFDTDDPLFKGFTDIAKEMNLSQKAYDKVVAYMGGVIAEQSAAEEAALADALTQLGQGADARIAAVDTYLQAELGEKGWESLQAAIGNDVAAYSALEKIVAKASGDAQLAGGTGQQAAAMTKGEIDAERYKVFPEGHAMAGKVMYEHDKAHRTKVDGMYKQAFPGDDHTQVG